MNLMLISVKTPWYFKIFVNIRAQDNHSWVVMFEKQMCHHLLQSTYHLEFEGILLSINSMHSHNNTLSMGHWEIFLTFIKVLLFTSEILKRQDWNIMLIKLKTNSVEHFQVTYFTWNMVSAFKISICYYLYTLESKIKTFLISTHKYDSSAPWSVMAWRRESMWKIQIKSWYSDST